MNGAAKRVVDNSTFARHYLKATDYCPEKWGYISLLTACILKVYELPSIVKTVEYLCDHAI